MTTAEPPVISVEELKTYYEEDGFIRSSPPVKAVDGVSLDIHEGETIGLVGESGCGKTTLGRTILGLNNATDGTVTAAGTDVTDLSGRERRRWQRRVGMVFQDPQESLNERMTVGEIIKEPLKTHDWPFLRVAVEDVDAEVQGSDVTPCRPDRAADITVRLRSDGTKVTVREGLPLTAEDLNVSVRRDGTTTVSVAVKRHKSELRRERAFELLEQVGLTEDHFYRYPHQFSGGQRQRIGIARALALEPDFLVLDEPVSALDVSVQARIINLLEDLQDELGLTYLFIAHDLSVVRHIADRVAVMYLGNIVELGPTREVYENPAHPYTVSLLSAIPGSGSPWEGGRVTLRGTPPSPRDPPAGCPFATRCPAKIRPDEWEFPERTWRALDELRVLFRTRARSERSATAALKSLVGLDAAGESLTETVEELLAEHDLSPTAKSVIEEALEHARAGDDAVAAQRLREAFGSRCDEEHPSGYDEGPGRTSACLRHEPEYESVAEVIAAREDE
ncbi:ATP-binding cassette domain-containing protein [Halorubrum ezzemoulense]|uniref:ABC transporter ATP-binding protein n=1 Tax=Halorubrum TaxID=56688 RepID=UPI0010F49375|nr:MULTISPECIES: oligopeptide/dipeptide ABC transporter ATP-binding protein [Halorubrum]MDB9250422.1 ATP-binding cassette domain-containing protein [Halorubrum ezzemoulense]MDB9254032.1 ATP-binding cassette domain-containing protein [Halorubrum ezzemoulense]MDB9257059.1 ATP-binding cassette domain-containing protein [Halorubrum ezzemoulense]MDB9260557.1 ATP-binding cassette domain-containing protein [Halorubrum ezzemoulense]MDB9263797.1 ATP-binding cassette domain-containing protein [Halorubru